MLRRILRRVLAILTKLTLAKHRARVVAIAGTGPNALLREYMFQVVNLASPAAQNVEVPDAEFSVPLTVLGTRGYPDNAWQWIKFIGKSFLQLLWIKPYSHVLVLEVETVSRDLTLFWLKVLDAEVYIDSTDVSLDKEEIIELVAGYGERFGVDKELALSLLADFRFPEPRVKILHGPGGSILLDATFVYYPANWKSVNELLAKETFVRKVIFTDGQQESLPSGLGGAWQVNPQNFSPALGELVVLSGYRPVIIKMYPQFFV